MAATVAAIFMLRVLQDFPLLFQRFPITPGNSTRHERDMESNAGREVNHSYNPAFLVPPGTFMSLAIW
jgi:hypothetical protein